MESFINAFIAYFVIVDPIGVSLIFNALTGGKSASYCRLMAVRAVVLSTVLVLCFGFWGVGLLTALGIEMASFKIAGGLLIFYAAFGMITKPDKADRGSGSDAFDDISVFQQMADVPESVRRELWPLVNTLLLTTEEIPLLTSGSAVDLLDLGPDMVVVKQGAAGCTIYERGQEPVVVPGYPVPVRDTSAAGDSFDAGFIVGAGWGWSSVECAKLANAVGAAKVQKLGGGRNVPTRADVQAVIEQFQVDMSFPEIWD